MATQVTIQKQPTSPNLSNGNLVFQVDDTSNSQPQYQYIADIKDASGNLIQRVKQQPNPYGYGIFDLSRIIDTQTGPTDNVWTITTATQNTSSGKDIQVIFGNEYGTSVSSSVTTYNGSGAAGEPAKSASIYYFMLDGTSNPNDKVGNFNWNSSSKYEFPNPLAKVPDYQFALTDFVTQSIRLEDYHTVSILNGNVAGKQNSAVSSSAQDVYIARIQTYDSSDSLLNTFYFYNTAGPRTGSSELWSDAYTNQSENTRLIHFPAGPQNFLDAGSAFNTGSTSYYTYELFDQKIDGSLGDTRWADLRFDMQTECTFTGTRFAWKNQYGVWDYFNFTLADNATTSITRKEYEQDFVNFGGNQVTYDRSRRGKSQFYNELEQKYKAESDYLTQTEADNLRELFYSTNVYIQNGSEYLPVIITNGSIEQKTNPRSQKLFRFTAEYQFANEITPRT